jgi:ubiquinone/menaquinone biosynthesis C-methylase UbiE
VAITLADETREAFDSVAAGYHRSNCENLVLRGMRQRTIAAVLRHAPRPSHLLDLGCGARLHDYRGRRFTPYG